MSQGDVSQKVFINPVVVPTLRDGKLYQQKRFVPPALVERLRNVINERLRKGDFEKADSRATLGATGGFEMLNYRNSLVCTPDLKDEVTGDLLDFFEALGPYLGQMLGREFSTEVELSFTVYPPGGFYRRHIDAVKGEDPHGTGRRSISFICYLTEPAGWDPSYGGVLRTYIDKDSEEPTACVLPECGSLLLYDSKQVIKEISSTKRELFMLTGSFLSKYREI